MQKSTVKVLDHGIVRLVDHMGDDLAIARSALIDPDADWHDDYDPDVGLIRYLWNHAQTSPFEAVTFQFEVRAPAFIFLQWHNNRAWTFTEIPARYAALPNEFYLPEPEVISVHPPSEGQKGGAVPAETELAKRQILQVRRHCTSSLTLGQQLLDQGWRPELVHGMMPLTAYRHMFVKMDLLHLLRFLQLRYDDETQYELRIYAEALRDLVRTIVPVALSTWEELTAGK